jgi:hypothetical protein
MQMKSLLLLSAAAIIGSCGANEPIEPKPSSGFQTFEPYSAIYRVNSTQTISFEEDTLVVTDLVSSSTFPIIKRNLEFSFAVTGIGQFVPNSQYRAKFEQRYGITIDTGCQKQELWFLNILPALEEDFADADTVPNPSGYSFVQEYYLSCL